MLQRASVAKNKVGSDSPLPQQGNMRPLLMVFQNAYTLSLSFAGDNI